MEAIYFSLGVWVAVSTLLGSIIYRKTWLYITPPKKSVGWAYVVSYAMVAFMLGFIPNGLILAAIWLALAAVQWAVSYITFNAANWDLKVTFWGTVAFHVLQVAALLCYLNF